MPYVELHAHSAYSFLDGASQPEELAARAAELGYPGLFVAVPEADVDALGRELPGVSVLTAPAVVHGIGLEPGWAWNINTAEISRVYLHPVFSFPKVTFTIALDEGGVLRAVEEPTHSAAWESSKPIAVTP